MHAGPSSVRIAPKICVRDTRCETSKVLVAPIEQPVDLGADNENLLPIPGGGERRAPNPTASTPFLGRISRAGSVGEGAVGPVKLAAKYKPQPAIMIGVLAQFEQSDNRSPAVSGRADQNWLAGPLTSVQLVPGTTLDARAAWGLLDSGVAANASGAERRLVDAKLSTTQSFGAWRFSPSVTMNLEETRPASSGHDGQPGLGTGTGRIDVKPELAYRFDMGQSLLSNPKSQ